MDWMISPFLTLERLGNLLALSKRWTFVIRDRVGALLCGPADHCIVFEPGELRIGNCIG